MKFRPIEGLILVAAVALLLISGGKLLSIFLEYKAGTDEYDDLQRTYVMQQGQRQEVAQEEVPEEFFIPEKQIDFDGLEAVNGQLAAWMYIPSLELEYPLVQGTDNEYYLDHTFEGTQNKAGAVFMDCAASGDFSDRNTFVYGHNMKNKSMFGKLKRFEQEEGLCAGDPYFYLYTRDWTAKYLIVSYYATQDGSHAYFCPATDEEYEEYLDWILSASYWNCDREIPRGNSILTLSTCHGAVGGPGRFVVHGICTYIERAGE